MPTRTPSLYDRWALRYPAVAHNPVMVAEQSAMVRRLAPLRSQCALDLGAGTGRYTAWLREQGVPRVVSLDQSAVMLQQSDPRHMRVQADARRLPFAGASFDLVVAGLVAGDIAHLASWLSEVRRVLRPGGHCVYSDFHQEWAARGWRRTFVDGAGETATVPFHPHTDDGHRSASRAAGFEWIGCDEALVEPPQSRLARARGRCAALPAVVVVALRNPAGCSGD